MGKTIKNKPNNILAITRYEDNMTSWLEGDYFGLASKSNYLQSVVKKGGTLWIVVSRENSKKQRIYSIVFKLQNCKIKTLNSPNRFGKYIVEGDPNTSFMYANNDARLLLMSLRFNPEKPIREINKIGQSIQRPRSLSLNDTKLLGNYITEIERWGVFISYKWDKHDLVIADKVYIDLESYGINIFQDRKSISLGSNWQIILLNAIKRSRCLILIIGKNTYRSDWVKKEINCAIEHNIKIIPIIAGGDLEKFPKELKLKNLQAVNYNNGKNSNFIQKILENLSSIYSPKKQ